VEVGRAHFVEAGDWDGGCSHGAEFFEEGVDSFSEGYVAVINVVAVTGGIAIAEMVVVAAGGYIFVTIVVDLSILSGSVGERPGTIS